MRVLTVRQPWASLIIFSGKDIENRTWPAPRGIISQRIAIHSSKALDHQEFLAAIDLCQARGIKVSGLTEDQLTQPGVILGTVLLTQCVRSHSSKWFVGPYGFVLTDPQPLARPIPAKGKLGFWEFDMEGTR